MTAGDFEMEGMVVGEEIHGEKMNRGSREKGEKRGEEIEGVLGMEEQITMGEGEGRLLGFFFFWRHGCRLRNVLQRRNSRKKENAEG
ncbi:hypothetical protein SLE2022_118620 [Rubroshorea leprosula]